MAVVVQVWDFPGRTPLGVQRVEAQVLARAEDLARARLGLPEGSPVRVSLRDLDLAQLGEVDLQWALEAEGPWKD